ncbi:MAG: alpha/beta hydrolase [Clostridia bacterium]|nr:alpha/beta hydrolase [Clostridia bacterium]
MNNKTVVYVHGKGGSADEAAQYRTLFPSANVYGIDYVKSTPWEVGKEIHDSIVSLCLNSDKPILIANSIGAYFSMYAGIEEYVEKAFFISPIVDMEKLIGKMMAQARVTDEELKRRGSIRTDSGEELSWDYYSFVKDHPVTWNVPTEVLYGSEDTLTDPETVSSFCVEHRAKLTVMDGGEHWFHTEEQLYFLYKWIKEGTNK